MPQPSHESLLRSGREVWNKWRKENPDCRPNLKGLIWTGAGERVADLSDIDLHGSDLTGARLENTPLDRADLRNADLSNSNLDGACLADAEIGGANFYGARLTSARLDRIRGEHASFRSASLWLVHGSQMTLNHCDFCDAGLSDSDLVGSDLANNNFSGADFTNASLRHVRLKDSLFVEGHLANCDLFKANCDGASFDRANMDEAKLMNTRFRSASLVGANLARAIMVETDFSGADLSGCWVYGGSAWDLNVASAVQLDIRITPKDRPAITVDGIEVAQFMYLLLNNQKIRDVIEQITSKVVLILGSFTPKRKVVLDAIRIDLRGRNYLPIVVDFESPRSRDLTETVSILAHLSRFVIADITDPSSIPHELMQIVPSLYSVPVQPLLLKCQRPYGMFERFERASNVLPPFLYDDEEHVIALLATHIIEPAERRAAEIAPKRRTEWQ